MTQLTGGPQGRYPPFHAIGNRVMIWKVTDGMERWPADDREFLTIIRWDEGSARQGIPFQRQRVAVPNSLQHGSPAACGGGNEVTDCR